MLTNRGEDIQITPNQAMAATRHLVLDDISRRLAVVEERTGSCDPECDRALTEIWRLARWIEARIGRNDQQM